MRANAKRTLNIIRVVAGKKRGRRSENPKKFYSAIYRKKMDYDCQVYISFSAEILKKLDSIHIRIYKRAFRTSPVETLHVEANNPQLELRTN